MNTVQAAACGILKIHLDYSPLSIELAEYAKSLLAHPTYRELRTEFPAPESLDEFGAAIHNAVAYLCVAIALDRQELIETPSAHNPIITSSLAAAIVDFHFRVTNAYAQRSLDQEFAAQVAALGRKGGKSTSAAKRAAARINGRKGGRPPLRPQQ